ncbi:MAG TPA: hypothetical protein VHZ55_03860, partial [Bryobacteraceae bacterium]|nr:hypothetical protein [Bryobacteraceae bacterium]
MIVHLLARNSQSARESSGGIGFGQTLQQIEPSRLKQNGGFIGTLNDLERGRHAPIWSPNNKFVKTNITFGSPQQHRPRQRTPSVLFR